MVSIVDRWARLELAPWVGVSIDGAPLKTQLRQLAEHDTGVGLFEFRNGVVRSIIGSPSSAAETNSVSLISTRGELYREFFQQVVDTSGDIGEGLLAISLSDRTDTRYMLPVFAFQKKRTARTPLLPDVDLIQLIADWTSTDDKLPFSDKKAEAIFVGSTTGGILTRDSVQRGANARVRSAQFFLDRSGVTFELPRIAQCDGPDTEMLVRSLGVTGREQTWAEQFCHRYLLSMDGNGATCSRVAIALRSNSVLVKYSSPNLLYFFHGLDSWQHYIPVANDEEVLELVAGARDTNSRDSQIAQASYEFAAALLSRQAVIEYAACLLRRYFEIYNAMMLVL